MPRTICVLNPNEADLVSRGIRPSCNAHQHVTRKEARLMTLGTAVVPENDPDYKATKGRNPLDWRNGSFISQDWQSSAAWVDDRAIVVYMAREWQVRGGVKQLLPLGATRQRRRRSRLHVTRPAWSGTATQCRDNNTKQEDRKAKSSGVGVYPPAAPGETSTLAAPCSGSDLKDNAHQ